MKKILAIISIIISLFVSCGKQENENINIFVSKNLNLLLKEIITNYEKHNHDIKINIIEEIPENFDDLDIVIIENEDIFLVDETNISDNNSKKQENSNNKKIENKVKALSYKDKFEKESNFADDNIVIIGKRKLNSLDELLYSSISVPNYENIVGKYFVDNLSESRLFNEISKKINYVNDSISAMQAADLSEADFAVINTLLLSKVRNSIICYHLFNNIDMTKENEEKQKSIENNENLKNLTQEQEMALSLNNIIIYKKYLKKESSSAAQNFYNFLESSEVQKMIDKSKIIS